MGLTVVQRFYVYMGAKFNGNGPHDVFSFHYFPPVSVADGVAADLRRVFLGFSTLVFAFL